MIKENKTNKKEGLRVAYHKKTSHVKKNSRSVFDVDGFLRAANKISHIIKKKEEEGIIPFKK